MLDNLSSWSLSNWRSSPSSFSKRSPTNLCTTSPVSFSCHLVQVGYWRKQLLNPNTNSKAWWKWISFFLFRPVGVIYCFWHHGLHGIRSCIFLVTNISWFLDAHASLAPTPVSPSVSSWYFRISILSASLSPHKASRRHCSDRHDETAFESSQ